MKIEIEEFHNFDPYRFTITVESQSEQAALALLADSDLDGVEDLWSFSLIDQDLEEAIFTLITAFNTALQDAGKI